MRSAFVLLAALAASLVPAAAWAGELPAPAGLRACAPDAQLNTMLARTATAMGGELSGCFVSAEKLTLPGEVKAITQPLEYAYAITMASGSAVPFTKADVDAHFARAQKQWKDLKPLDKQARDDYQKKVEQLIAETSATKTTEAKLSIEAPVLVSMERLDVGSYLVITIRKRKVSMGGDTYVSTAVDGSGLVLKQGKLIRLSLVRELRFPADINRVKDAVRGWVQGVGANT